MRAGQNMINYTRYDEVAFFGRFPNHSHNTTMQMNPNYPERAAIAQLPTPLEALQRLSKHLGGPELWIKRDDTDNWGNI